VSVLIERIREESELNSFDDSKVVISRECAEFAVRAMGLDNRNTESFLVHALNQSGTKPDYLLKQEAFTKELSTALLKSKE